VLPPGIGILITESSSSLDTGAIESIVATTHARKLVTGFGVEADIQLRAVVDPRTQRRRFFTLHAARGAVVERTAGGTFIREWQLGASRSNPQDMALANDGSIWVTQYEETKVAILSEDSDQARAVDLAGYADADGKPDMSAITIVGETAYVALRRLSRGFQPESPSVLVAVDTGTLAARKVLDFPARNPWQEFRRRGDSLWATCIGGPLSQPPVLDAALVRIDLTTGAAESVASQQGLNGFVTAFDFLDDRRVVASVAAYESGNPTAIVVIDVVARMVTATWMRTADYKLWDVVAIPDHGIVLVANRTETAPGIEVLSAQDGTKLGKVSTRLLPIELVVTRAAE